MVCNAEGILDNLITGEHWDLSNPLLHPLDLAARLVQEDLCLMQPRDGVYRLAAASVCFPSRWKLSEKIGRPMLEIHVPVPFYGEKIGAATDKFMNSLPAGRPVWRVNWSVHDTPELFQPSAPASGLGVITASNAGEKLCLRVERQTLRRLSRSNDILFTIRTIVQPLAEYENQPAAAAALAAAIRSLPRETFAYKSLAGFADVVLEWLENIRE